MLCRFSAVVAGGRVAVLPDVLGAAPVPTVPGRPPFPRRGDELAVQAGAGMAHSRRQQTRNASFHVMLSSSFSRQA